jgi:fluoroacetyl-CoA thioesterase
MSPELKTGLRHERSLRVEENLTVPALSQVFARTDDMPPVLATAYLIGFVEWTCVDALRPFLEPQERTLGTHVDLSHAAATPVGLSVTASVELVEMDGRRLRFAVSCSDGVDVICTGFHERTFVNAERFLARVARKQSEAPPPA